MFAIDNWLSTANFHYSQLVGSKYNGLTEELSLDRLRGLDKREYLVIIKDNFCYFSLKSYVVTFHLNHLITVLTRGHNICFLCRINKNYPKLSSNIPSYP